MDITVSLSPLITALTFTLAANAAVKRSGNHTLVVRWKFESI